MCDGLPLLCGYGLFFPIECPSCPHNQAYPGICPISRVYTRDSGCRISGFAWPPIYPLATADQLAHIPGMPSHNSGLPPMYTLPLQSIPACRHTCMSAYPPPPKGIRRTQIKRHSSSGELMEPLPAPWCCVICTLGVKHVLGVSEKNVRVSRRAFVGAHWPSCTQSRGGGRAQFKRHQNRQATRALLRSRRGSRHLRRSFDLNSRL